MSQADYHDPDWQLIRAMAAGDAGALDELYARHGPYILSFLVARLRNRQLAEEVLQDVMLSAWNSAASFREESKVRTWLLVIARNRAINMQRKRKLQLVQLYEEGDMLSEDTSPSQRMERYDNKSLVREAINQLPEHQREVLVLVFYHQLSGPEVADVLDISVGTVKSRLHRAKEMLKRVLMKEDGL